MDVMEEIKKAEKDAEELRRQALLEARQIVKSTEEALRQEERQAVLELRDRIAAFHKARDREVDVEVRALAELRGGERLEKMEKAKRHLGEASAYIYGRIVQDG